MHDVLHWPAQAHPSLPVVHILFPGAFNSSLQAVYKQGETREQEGQALGTIQPWNPTSKIIIVHLLKAFLRTFIGSLTVSAIMDRELSFTMWGIIKSHFMAEKKYSPKVKVHSSNFYHMKEVSETMGTLLLNVSIKLFYKGSHWARGYNIAMRAIASSSLTAGVLCSDRWEKTMTVGCVH